MKEFKVGDEVATLIGAGDIHEFGYSPRMPTTAGAVGEVLDTGFAGTDRPYVEVKFSGERVKWHYCPSELEHVRSKGSLYESVTIHGDEIQTQVSLQNENASLRQQLNELEKEEKVLRDRLLTLDDKIQRKRDYIKVNTYKLKAWDTLLDKGA